MPDRIWCCDSELSEGEKSTGRHSGLVLNIVNIATIMTSFSVFFLEIFKFQIFLFQSLLVNLKLIDFPT